MSKGEKLMGEKECIAKKIDHIGIAVRSIKDALPFYVDCLHMPLIAIEEVTTQQVRVAFLQVGESKVELLEPISDTSPIAKFIEKKGEGIHHVALGVTSIEERISQMKANGIPMIHDQPVEGAGGANVAFLHPKGTGGVLYEFCEKK